MGAYYRGHDEPPERHMTVSLDCIKSLMDGVDHINHDQSFSLDIVCKGTFRLFIYLLICFCIIF